MLKKFNDYTGVNAFNLVVKEVFIALEAKTDLNDFKKSRWFRSW